ncbi:MAG: Holliday junction resolvase RuvX [Anaerolineae bacterium]
MRYLALDLGDRRIGIALSDRLGMVARPLEVMKRTSRAADFAHVSTLVAEHDVDALIVGLPISMDGTEDARAAWTRDYGQALGKAVGLPVTFWDERLSTEEAEAILRAKGKHLREEKNWIDAVAAAVILQRYLDAKAKTVERHTDGV